ncbi:integrase arm-type DNA-binding domain-containing protein [Mesorhizobium sp. BR1-1-9]|uniref:tyrosine-type recombinase/integrase n=1 Tax=Mesorhizobium sp. BR1-1-9 TaxID=2876646 RepID=UPI001CD1768D|nr:site-specific integrase [Mesorhizobium sp. BR1-1-9]MBZ9873472.1 integrase arm-type DNA-binding domain-containing protein [Mesorhizobium sp. BR1-1-9]
MGSHTLNALTVKKIEASKSNKLRDGGGLWLVTKGKGRYWILDYRFDGKRREMGLGPLHTVGLAEARQRSQAARDLLRQGLDPVEHRHGLEAIEAAKAVTAGKTFGEYADDYIDAAVKAGRWRGAKTEAGWRNTLTNHAAPLRRKAIAKIDVPDVLAVLRPLWGEKQETAEKLRERIERVLDSAKVEGLRIGENPAAWRGNLEHVLHKPDTLTNGSNHAALPYSKAPVFMRGLCSLHGMGARALEFTILTAARSGEVRGAGWPEIDLAKALWVIPAKRMKSGKEHRVALSDAAVRLLKATPRFEDNYLVFPAVRGGELSDMTLAAVLKRMHAAEIKAGRDGWLDPKQLDKDGKPKVVTVHGFRSTFRDWTKEATDHPRELAEIALAHAVGDAVERAYARGDALEKRRQLMADWAAYCGKLSQVKK